MAPSLIRMREIRRDLAQNGNEAPIHGLGGFDVVFLYNYNVMITDFLGLPMLRRGVTSVQ